MSEKKKEGLEGVLRVQTLSHHGTIHGSCGAEGGREGEKGRRRGCTGTMAYPHHHRPIHHGLPTRTTAGLCGSDGIRVLHADDANRGWCGFVGAGNTGSVRSLDVDKVEAADSLTRAVVELKESNIQDARKYMEFSSNGLSINQRGAMSDKLKKVACARAGQQTQLELQSRFNKQ